MLNTAKMKVEGHLFMVDADTKEVLVNQHNDIHLENFCEAMALSMANFSNGFIEELHFGGGGSIINSTGAIDYFPPNTSEPRDSADLLGSNGIIYSKVVNDRSSEFVDDPTKTNIKVVHVPGTTYTDLIVTCTLDYGEPKGQAAFDNATDMEAPYVFDELGLFTVDTVANKKRLLTHVIFHPVQKALNRAIEIIYTVRITMFA